MTQTHNRPSVDHYFLTIARVVATRATCRHRHQGAVLVNHNRIISSGYNGSPPGQSHCIDLDYCNKENGGLCRAEGLHGESNAITVAARLGIPTDGSVLYSVYSPCVTCCNMLRVAGIKAVKFIEVYDSFQRGPEYLKELGIVCQQIKMD